MLPLTEALVHADQFPSVTEALGAAGPAQPVLPRGLLSPEHIIFTTSLHTPDDLFERVGRIVHHPGTASAARIADRLRKRHARRSTALGHGIALPHAEIAGLRSAVAVFIRSRHGLPFDAHDGKLVVDVLTLLVPRPAMARHHDMLASLDALLGEPAFRQSLAECNSAHAVWQLFAGRGWG